MNLSSIEKELFHLQALIARWKEQKYTPPIERDIALDRLRKLYEELLDAHTEDPLPAMTDSEPSRQTEQPAEQIAPPQPIDEPVIEEQDECADDQCESQISEFSQVIDDMTPSSAEEPQTEDPQIEEPQPTETQQDMQISPSQIEDEARCHRFIHDLFCNDETFYTGEMRKIEALTSLDEVLIYIGQKYAWTPDNATAAEFVAWIATRFDD